MRNFTLSHHAYIVAGSRDAVVAEVLRELEENFALNTKGNPDIVSLHFESLGIDESRELKNLQGSRPVAGDRKIFLVSTNALTVQAQNAMLKMFEEPVPSTHFFLIVPSLSIIIDTLASRLMILEIESEEVSAKELIPAAFLKSSYPERLKSIETFLKAYKDLKTVKSVAHTFLSGVEALLAKDIKKNAKTLEKLAGIKKYMFDTSASVKILLETAALILPIF